VAIIGTGNIGTDLMIKVLRQSDVLEMGPWSASTRLRRAGPRRRFRVRRPPTAWTADRDGRLRRDRDRLRRHLGQAHVANAEKLAPYGKTLVDLTPAAIGPYVIPPVNLDEHLAGEATD
jgi:acetaldehyde dehydrogenase